MEKIGKYALNLSFASFERQKVTFKDSWDNANLTLYFKVLKGGER